MAQPPRMPSSNASKRPAAQGHHCGKERLPFSALAASAMSGVAGAIGSGVNCGKPSSADGDSAGPAGCCAGWVVAGSGAACAGAGEGVLRAAGVADVGDGVVVGDREAGDSCPVGTAALPVGLGIGLGRGVGLGVGLSVGITRGAIGTGPASSAGPSTVGVGVGLGGSVKSCTRCCAASGDAISAAARAIEKVQIRVIMRSR